MLNTLNVIGAVTEVFTWLGVLATLVFGIMVIVIVMQQSSWIRVHAMLEEEGAATVARWFDDGAGSVGAAILTPAQALEIGGADHADVWVRRGRSGAIRLHATSPARRPAMMALTASAGLLIVSLAISVTLLIAEG